MTRLRKTKIPSAPGQTTIDRQMAKTRRGQHLLDRREARYGSIYHRMLIWLLDDHIGDKETYDLTFADLAWGAEMSESQAYQVANELKESGLIDFEETGPNTAKYTFRIIRSNIAELAAESGQVPPRRRRGRPKKIVHSMENIPQHGKPFHTVENPSTAWKTFPHGGNAPYIERRLTPPTPPTTAGQPPAWERVEVELIDLGIQETEKPLEKLRETGCRPEQALAVIAFWRSQPGRWCLGKLRRRLINLRPGQDPEDLRYWPTPDVGSEPARPQKPQLPADAESLRELIDWALGQNLSPEQRRYWERAAADPRLLSFTAQLPGFIEEYRPALKSAFEKRQRCPT